MPALPFLADLFPVPTALLCQTLCPLCEGAGYLESFDPMLSERCTGCYGSGVQDVCEACGLTPSVQGGVEVCGCTTCENCGNFPSVTDGVCAICYGATLKRIREEADPNLQAWEELKARDMTPAEVAAQMKQAEEWGWL